METVRIKKSPKKNSRVTPPFPSNSNSSSSSHHVQTYIKTLAIVEEVHSTDVKPRDRPSCSISFGPQQQQQQDPISESTINPCCTDNCAVVRQVDEFEAKIEQPESTAETRDDPLCKNESFKESQQLTLDMMEAIQNDSSHQPSTATLGETPAAAVDALQQNHSPPIATSSKPAT